MSKDSNKNGQILVVLSLISTAFVTWGFIDSRKQRKMERYKDSVEQEKERKRRVLDGYSNLPKSLRPYYDAKSTTDVFKHVANYFNDRKFALEIKAAYALETDFFSSGQYKACLSAGQIAVPNHDGGYSYPYGWVTANRLFWSKYPQTRPTGMVFFTENQGGRKAQFLKYDHIFDAVFTMAFHLDRYNRNVARWNSTDHNQQIKYRNAYTKLINDKKVRL